MKAIKFSVIIFLVFVAMGTCTEAFSQCAMCKASAEAASKADTSVGEQINAGILYLMVIPYLVFFVFFRKKIRSLFKQLKEAARH